MAFGISIRLTHTGLAGGSIFIDDLRESQDRATLGRNEGPCYVPVGGSVELVYGGITAISFERGAIRSFITRGYLTADFVVSADFITAITTASNAGKWLQFGANTLVPAAGTLYLQGPGGVVSSSVGHRMLRAGAIKGASVQLDAAVGIGKSYKLSVRLNGVEVATVPLVAGDTGSQNVLINVAYVAGDTLEAAMILTGGAGDSAFNDILALIEVVDS